MPDASARDAAAPWPVHDEVKEYIINGYLQGWGLCGQNVDVDVGTALFGRRADVRRWNEDCVAQVEAKYGDRCEAIDIHGFDPRERTQSARRPTQLRKLHGIQTPEILKLRTCTSHRARVMLLKNENLEDGCANGTQARLQEQSSWTGKSGVLQKSPDGTWIAPQLHLTQHPGTDFFVRIIRDAPTAFGKIVRYLREDCISVGVSTDHSIDPRSGYAEEWAQVQLVLAYALTIHKSQGVTMPVSYPALQGTFGFGMPYTLLTRTLFSSNMLFVGVPPKDIYEAILTRLADKRRTVQVLLEDESALESSLRARIQSGEFDLSAIGKRLVECDASVVDSGKETCEKNLRAPHGNAAKVERIILCPTHSGSRPCCNASSQRRFQFIQWSCRAICEPQRRVAQSRRCSPGRRT